MTPGTPRGSIPAYVEARLREPIPADCEVLAGSTPVAAFGNPTTSRVATLGINPSKLEFQDGKGNELTGAKRRFETLTSLKADQLADADHLTVQRVWDRCTHYFHGNPYTGWFNRLNEILQGVGASYYADTACHLDLTQWTTSRKWQEVDGRARATLVAADREFLRAQLENEPIELLLLNGRAVVNAFRDSLGGTLKQEPNAVADGSVTTSIFTGRHGDVRVLGWSTNLQSSFGVTRILRAKLAIRISELSNP